MDIRGYDIDDKAVRATRRNLQEAGFGGVVTVDQGDVLETQPLTDHGILVANPPYGERIGEQDELAAFYPQLGTALKRTGPAGTASSSPPTCVCPNWSASSRAARHRCSTGRWSAACSKSAWLPAAIARPRMLRRNKYLNLILVSILV
jgi:hypothetical protein